MFMSILHQPLLSVVTVSYNAVSTIEETICSVINQTYSNIEYIIIDGGSTDGTVDIIKKYADKIAYWVSEPDKGIYDAMNKGIDVATGEWINFMNSGDTFHSNRVIQQLIENLPSKADVVYGDTLLVYSWGKHLQKALPEFAIEKNQPSFCHQSCLIKTALIQRMKYNTRYKICADYDFFYRLRQEGGLFSYLSVCISNYEAEQGVSAINILLVQKELAIITGQINNINWKFRYAFLYLRIIVMTLIKKMLPGNIMSYYYRKRYGIFVNAIKSMDAI
ncbi:MAG: glycosyltransferase [Odoribacter sp.]|nr:glycosyltransferase [Odoribacter sp.]